MNDPNSARRQSRFGTASVMIGGGLPLLVTLLLILGGSDHDKHSNHVFAFAFAIVGLLAPLLHLTGLILGMIGLRAKEAKKSFSIAGILLNLFFGLIGVGIIYFFATHTGWTAFR